MAQGYPLRFAFVGAGWIARTVWIPLLREMGAEVVSIVDPAPSALAESREILPQVRTAQTLSVGALDKCDVAFICSPNAFHFQHALFALEQGLHVVVEKPACFRIADADSLINASLDAGRGILVTSASSHRRDTAEMLAITRDGTLGSPFCVDASWRRGAGIPRPGSWFTREETAIGGCGADLGWHLLEVALGLLNYPLVTAALSRQVRPGLAPERVLAAWFGDASDCSDAPMDVDSQLFACLQTASGPLVRLTTAWASHQATDETSIALFASAGEMTLHSIFGFSTMGSGLHRLTLLKDGVSQELPCNEDKMAPYRGFVRAMVDYLRTPELCADPRTQSIHRQLRSLASAMAFLYPDAHIRSRIMAEAV